MALNLQSLSPGQRRYPYALIQTEFQTGGKPLKNKHKMSHKKTPAQHKKDGTFRKDRHQTKTDTSGNLTALPPAPIPLSDEAAKIYKEEGAELISMNILRAENLRLLALYASEVAVYIEQMEKATVEGIVIELPNGISTSSAHRKAAESALKNATAIGDKLGLSPIGRARMGIKVEARTTGRKPSILDLIKQGKPIDTGAHFLEN